MTTLSVPPGTVFARLTVITEAPAIGGRRAMLCQCECGKQKPVRLASLRNGRTTSCGCSHYGELPDLARLNPGEVPLCGAKAAGRVTLVDVEDYDLVMQYRWTVDEGPRRNRPGWHGPYAKAYLRGPKPQPVIRMHTLITGWALVDHEDGNGLNNRRSNLRDATVTQNNANQRKARGTSHYKGVSWVRKDRRWKAQIKDGTANRYIGHFMAEEEAARAYDAAAIAAWGEFALLNFPAEHSR